MSAKELLDKQFDWYDKSPTSGIKLYFECVVIEAMEEYATLKLQEQAKEIERLKGEKWIRVEDSLPLKDGNDSIMCLVRTTSNQTLCRPYNEYHKCWDDEDYDDHFTTAVGGKVTHWQPLPPKPIN
jgi:hypothetical protein